jgi:acetyl esterase/lipase
MALPRPDRRTLLAGIAAVWLGGCGSSSTPDQEDDDVDDDRISYGADPSQWVDVREPAGPSRGVVVVIHGGFWKAEYGADLGVPLAEDLVGRGWTSANVEYRRVGNGGGFPETSASWPA